MNQQTSEMATNEPMADLSKNEEQSRHVEESPSASFSKAVKKRAARMAGFMFWTNAVGVVLLLIGFLAPGWFTARTNQIIHSTSNSWEEKENIKYKTVFQDYGLWYITQCEGTTCETQSYRLIDFTTGYCFQCEKIEIGSLVKTIEYESELLFFSGAVLLVTTSKINQIQAIYIIGLLLALTSLYIWYILEKHVVQVGILRFSKTKWMGLSLLAFLSALFVCIAVAIFASIAGDVGQNAGTVFKSFGSVFAGFGGAAMALTAAVIVLQLICCRNTEKGYRCRC